MMHEEKKIVRIVEELTMYFFGIGATNIKTDIKKEDTHVVIHMESDYLPEYRHNVESLEVYLNEPRNESMEDFFWELAGSGEVVDSSQILLLGAMIDKASVAIKKNTVSLTLYKQLFEG